MSRECFFGLTVAKTVSETKTVQISKHLKGSLNEIEAFSTGNKVQLCEKGRQLMGEI